MDGKVEGWGVEHVTVGWAALHEGGTCMVELCDGIDCGLGVEEQIGPSVEKKTLYVTIKHYRNANIIIFLCYMMNTTSDKEIPSSIFISSKTNWLSCAEGRGGCRFRVEQDGKKSIVSTLTPLSKVPS